MNRPLKSFLKILCLLWFIALLIGWIQKDIFHATEVYWYPLYLRAAQFCDFTFFQEKFKHFHEASFFDDSFNYPALAAYAYHFFFMFGSYALAAYLTFCAIVFIVAGIFLGRAIHLRGLGARQTALFIAVCLLLSYPLYFLMDRANIEMVCWMLVALGVTAYWHKRWYLAAAFLGAAISFKIFPFVFVGLLISSRKYLAVVWCACVSAIITCVATWQMGPTFLIAWRGLASAVAHFRMRFMLEAHSPSIGADHSIFAILKEVTYKSTRSDEAQHLFYLPMFNVYMTIAATTGILLFFWKIRHLPRPNQILSLTVASILLPPVSYDYTLVYLYIPWAVLVLLSISRYQKLEVRGLGLCFACLAFLMAPETYLVIHRVTISGQLKAIALMVLFVVSIRYPFKEESFSSNISIST